ncbi:RNA-dependent RNA polymerase [Caloscypha fulgens fusagravirus 1]|uniref:RNA-directed RNA polymerase n=1 Tax=Caloscypha fulgens fusagravirus 1 TaxID=2831243 RepID=A0AAE7RAY0_9VIRU|nr:RNA-dependent RNA polymerase [Caloscypha fulgens fusagravirus 1]
MLLSRGYLLKLSGGLNGRGTSYHHPFGCIDIVRAFDDFDLNSPPSNLESAALRYLFLNPTPREVWHYMPSSFYWRDLLQPYDIVDFSCSLENPPYKPASLGRETVDRLGRSYPNNVGRAGAKTLLTSTEIVRSSLHPLSKRMISLLFSLQRGSHAGWENQSLCGLLLLPHMSDMAPRITTFFLRNPHLMALDFSLWVKFLKALHTGIRITSTLPDATVLSPEESRQLYGLDVLPGRSESLSHPFKDEILIRMRDPVARGLPNLNARSSSSSFDFDSYPTVLQASIEEAVSSSIPETITEASTFSEWYAKRMFWAAAGGAPGAKVRWATDEPCERLSKRGALLTIPESHFRNIMRNALGAVLYSKAAPKFENGKVRAIWNTSVEHYIIQAYILDIFDAAQLNDSWSSASNSITKRLRRVVERTLDIADNVGLMWDYSDFNINHSFFAMSTLFSTIVRQISNRLSLPGRGAEANTIKSDLTRALIWVNEAREFTVLEDPESGFISRVVRSLQSGERATSTVNTFLSRSYFIFANRFAHYTFGSHLLREPSDHQGDDVWAVAMCMLAATIFCSLMNLLGFAGQIYKIMCDYRSRGEFLREHYDSESLKVCGYPIRTCMGLIAGEFFREGVFDPSERAASFGNQIAKCIRRGASIPESLFKSLVARNTPLTYTLDSGKKRRILVPEHLMNSPSALGGYGALEFADYSATSILDANPTLGNITSSLHKAPFSPQFSVPWYLIIPSGEGKTFLARTHPDIFVDHDDLIDHAIHDRNLKNIRTDLHGREVGWDQVAKYLSSVTVPIGKVLLTWGPSSAPSSSRCLGAFLLTNGTGLRANYPNRQSLLEDRSVKKYFYESFARRDSAIIGQLVPSLFELLSPNPLTFQKYSSPHSRPTFSQPKVNDKLFFKRYDRSLVPDFNAAHLLGVDTENRAISSILLESALPGGYRSKDISSQAALFARDLEKWIVTCKPTQIHTCSIPSQRIISMAKQYFSASISLITPFPSSKPHSSLPVNHFGAFNVLTTIFGFSLSSSMLRSIQALSPRKYPGLTGKWMNALVQNKEAFSHPVSNIFIQLVNLYSGHELSPTIPTPLFDNSGISLIANYFSGSLSFYPPFYRGFSPAIVTFSRQLTLAFVETLPNVFSSSSLELYDLVHYLEDLCSLQITAFLAANPNGPITIRD